MIIFILIQELGVDKFNFFRFANYDYCRKIIVDGKECDSDDEFCHDDIEATEALCAIDFLIADSEKCKELKFLKILKKELTYAIKCNFYA